MTARELLAQMARLNIKLWLDGDQLRFKSPQGVMTPELRAGLAKYKTEIVARLQESANRNRVDLPKLIPVARTEQLPLSFAQQRLWFLDQFEPGSACYNIPSAIRLIGQLDEAALQQTVSEIVRRHEALRTTFAMLGGAPVQVIAEQLEVPLKVIDLSGMPENEREARAQQLAQDEAQTPFELSTGPLIRVRLLRLDATVQIVLFTLHHIVSDGWSMGILVNEVAALYAAYVRKQPSPLPELPIQYADFAVWQRQWLQGDILEKELSYWKYQLADLPIPELLTDGPRPIVASFKGACHRFLLPKTLTNALLALSRREGVTLFMTLLAVLQTLLYRYTNQKDIVVGSPIANRARSEIEGLIGFFVNTLVLRTRLSGDMRFLELLQAVKEVTLGAYAHQNLPFERLVKELQPERDLSRNPLFQVLFALENAPMPQIELEDVQVNLMEVEDGTAQFDLVISMMETDTGLNGWVKYKTGLFDDSTVTLFVRHFQVLLEGVASDPDQPLWRLPLLTQPEWDQLISKQNTTRMSHSPRKCIQEVFQDQVFRTPEATAVVFKDEHLTYAALNARANQLARYLKRKGAHSGTLIAVYEERTPELIVSIVGILKTGAAYLPIDERTPQDRLLFMLKDSRARLMLTREPLVKGIPFNKLPDVSEVILLDQIGDEIAHESSSNLDHERILGAAAYVIYTSGSSGDPKGVVVEHGNVSRLFSATQPWFDFSHQDIWTLFHSYAFDFSVWEIWGALFYGGQLIVVPLDVARSPDDFYDLLLDRQATVLNQTPTAFQQLIQAEERMKSSLGRLSLRWIIFGGEALRPANLAPWFNRYGDKQPQLINMYGITETTVHVTYRPITIADLDSGKSSPIGRAIPDLQIYLLDSHGQPVPAGVPGELYVGGAGLAQGYLGQSSLTAGRFIPNSFSFQPGDRLYRSGDLARYLPDGDIEYLGRIDDQVKIHGFRIELAEIEKALCRHPSISEAIVIVREAVDGNKQLIAYVVPVPDVPVSIQELRSSLVEKLPDYMIPAAFISLQHLPVTPNGKIDRRALPAPRQVRPDLHNLERVIEKAEQLTDAEARAFLSEIRKHKQGKV